ncbi:GAF domain-containing protein [Gloeothece verrucosa]|uniref:Circadian input-output histidine kinase CikA n=1 Tax=Gloeothece verrucosa (strain PCC 7822) TaxID=497965 RepID=E0U7N0_GLOV7|nr:GAF domain-containing protein [Gloeothece verrucosa]ADN14842.1 multi-sensor signal transduction histidine kinase [Gloeothece verrucosa PCC 7822]
MPETQSSQGKKAPRPEKIQKDLLSKQVAQQKALLGVVTKIRESLDLDSIFNSTVTEVRQLLESDRVGIYRFESQSNGSEGKYVAESVLIPYQSMQEIKIDNKCFEHHCKVYSQQGKIWTVDDFDKTSNRECSDCILEALNIKASLAVPLHQGKELWGLLLIDQCSHPRRWSKQEIEFADQIAVHLSIAIQQAQLLVQQEQQTDILATTIEQIIKREQAVAAIIDKIRRSLDLNSIFKTSTAEVRQLLQADRVAIYRFNPDWSGQFIIESVTHPWNCLIEQQLSIPEIKQNISRCSVRELKNPQITDTYLEETEGKIFSKQNLYKVCDDIYEQKFSQCYINILEHYQVRAYIIVAIYEGEKLWGLLAAYQNSAPRQWSKNEINFLTQVGVHLGVALQQAELLAKTQQRQDELQTALTLELEKRAQEFTKEARRERSLSLVIDKIRRTLDINTIFQTAALEIQKLLAAEQVCIYKFGTEGAGHFICESNPLNFSSLLKYQWKDEELKAAFGANLEQFKPYILDKIIDPKKIEQPFLISLNNIGIKSAVFVPLVQRETLWGVLTVFQNSAYREWTADEINLLQKLATQLEVGLQQTDYLKQIQISVEQQANAVEQQKALSQVIDKIRRTLDLEIIFQTTVTEVRQLLKVDRVAVFQFEPDSNHTTGKFICEDVSSSFESVLSAKIKDSCFAENYARDYQQGKIGAVANIYEAGFSECHIALLARFQIKANLIAPLLKGDQLWGFLCIHQCVDFREWKESEIEFVSKIAANLGVAIQQTQLLVQAEKRSSELQQALAQVQFQKEQQATVAEQERALSQVIDKIRRTLDINTIFQTAAVEVRQLLQADRVAVFQFNRETEYIEGKFISEDVKSEFESALAVKISDHCFGEVYANQYQQGKILAIADIYQSQLQSCHLELLARFEIRANLIIPLLKGEQLWGLLCIHQCRGARQWQDAEIEFSRKIAIHLGVALQQAELLERANQRSEQLQVALAEVRAQKELQARIAEQEKALFQVIEKIRLTLDLKTIFQTTATEVRQLLQADRVAIFKFDIKSSYTQGTFVSEDVLPDFDSAMEAKVEDSCFGKQYATYYQQGRIFSLEDIDKAEILDCHRQILSRFQIKANLVAPLLKGQELWGLLCIHQCSVSRQWNDLDKQFVSKIAVNLGVALQQADLLAQSEKRSSELQIALAQVQAQKEHLAQVAAQEKALARVIERIRQTLDLETIFRTTTQEVREILKCDRVVVYRFYGDWSGEFMYESVAPGWKSLTWKKGVKTVWEDTFLQENKGGRYRYHEIFAIDDIHQAGLTDCHVEILEHFQVKAFVVVPVFVGEQLWGLLGAYQNSQARHWEQREINLLTQAGNQLGVGVYQAQLLEQTQQQSNILQTTLADLNAIVDNLADGLLVTDIHGFITRFNPALLSMFNLTDNLKGKHLSEVLSLDLANLVRKIGRQQKEIVTAEVELGSGRSGQALVSSIFQENFGDEEEPCLGSVILIRDVTSEREVDRMKTEFLATVSHELRTPLTSVLGFTSLIQEKLEEVIFPAISSDETRVKKARKKVGQNIKIIISEAERLTALINDVLDIAKMEAGRMEWNIKSTSVVEILETASAATYPLFDKKKIDLIKDFPLNLPNIWVDKNRMIQVVINLLSNAVKFTDEGSVTCCAKLEDDQLVISITDTGIGIAENEQSKIFERFQQGGNILTDKPTGTGLGLPICKQIVEYHGGKIWVISAPHQGSTFFFSLPLSGQEHEPLEKSNEG